MINTIKDIDNYCRLYNKAIVIHKGNFCGFREGYNVGIINEDEVLK